MRWTEEAAPTIVILSVPASEIPPTVSRHQGGIQHLQREPKSVSGSGQQLILQHHDYNSCLEIVFTFSIQAI